MGANAQVHIGRGVHGNPITEDLAYYNQLTKTGEAHKATCLCSRTTLNLRIPRITPNIAHANNAVCFGLNQFKLEPAKMQNIVQMTG